MNPGTGQPRWELDNETEPAAEREPVPGAGTAELAEPALLREPVPGTGAWEPEPGPEPVTGNREPGTGPAPGTGHREPGTGADAGTGPAEPGTRTRPLPAGPVRWERNRAAENAWDGFRNWARRNAAEQKKHGGFWNWLWEWVTEKNPDSAREVIEYGSSLEWMQPYMTGWIRVICKWENWIYNRTFGVLFVTLFNVLSDIFARQSRLAAAGLIAVIAYIIYLAHH